MALGPFRKCPSAVCRSHRPPWTAGSAQEHGPRGLWDEGHGVLGGGRSAQSPGSHGEKGHSSTTCH